MKLEINNNTIDIKCCESFVDQQNIEENEAKPNDNDEIDGEDQVNSKSKKIVVCGICNICWSIFGKKHEQEKVKSKKYF